MVWTVAVVAVTLAALAFYTAWTASRLDRRHARIDAAAAALDGELRLRATAAVRLSDSAQLPRAAVTVLAPAAARAAEAVGLGHDREAVENALSRVLQEITPQLDRDQPEVTTLADAMMRATFARRFHNDAVRDALVVRRRRIVRLLRLAGHAPQPTYFEMDDAPLGISDVAPAAAPYD